MKPSKSEVFFNVCTCDGLKKQQLTSNLMVGIYLKPLVLEYFIIVINYEWNILSQQMLKFYTIAAQKQIK